MKDKLTEALENLDDTLVYEYVRQYREMGVGISEIQALLNEGMRLVGLRYKEGAYYISDLIFSGVIYVSVLNMPQMQYSKTGADGYIGTVVAGTIKNDMHDIGKNIFLNALACEGFRVVDLGVDVSRQQFLTAVRQHKPDILAMSGIMNFALTQIREVIQSLRQEGLLEGVMTIVGGSSSYADALEFLGADAYGEDAFLGVDLCLKFIQEKYADDER